MIKAVFFDFDGTIYSHKTKGIPESAKDALLKLKKNGTKFFLATGRNMLEFKSLFPCVFDIPFDGYVLMNGQLCLGENFEILDEHPFRQEALESLIKMFNSKKKPVVLVEEKDIYINCNDPEIRNYYGDILAVEYPVKTYSGNPVYLGVMYLNKNEESEVLKELPGCSFQRWGEHGVDVVNEGMHKAKGIELLINKLGIGKEECMAVGDSYNDIKMLNFVGTAVAMGNAVQDLKNIADFITDDIDDNGIANALKKFGLI